MSIQKSRVDELLAELEIEAAHREEEIRETELLVKLHEQIAECHQRLRKSKLKFYQDLRRLRENN